MAEYQITFARSARKEFDELPVKIAERILGQIEALQKTPRPVGGLKLKGANLWRIRVGDYRVVYKIDDAKKVVDVSLIRHRKDVYRGL